MRPWPLDPEPRRSCRRELPPTSKLLRLIRPPALRILPPCSPAPPWAPPAVGVTVLHIANCTGSSHDALRHPLVPRHADSHVLPVRQRSHTHGLFELRIDRAQMPGEHICGTAGIGANDHID